MPWLPLRQEDANDIRAWIALHRPDLPDGEQWVERVAQIETLLAVAAWRSSPLLARVQAVLDALDILEPRADG